LADLVYEAGEIVPRCSCTLDVYVANASDVTIDGQFPSERPARLVRVFPAENGLVCVRVALWGGDRLKVKTGEQQ
jgi:hypothetical protein